MTAATTGPEGRGPAGIVGYHAYLPAYRLNRADIAAALAEGGDAQLRPVDGDDQDPVLAAGQNVVGRSRWAGG